MALNQILDNTSSLKEGVDNLQPKPKPVRPKKIQLRDAIQEEHYLLFMKEAGQTINRQKKLRIIQLKLIYTVLYFLGLRVNETKFLQKDDFFRAIQTGEFNIVHTKTNECQIYILPDKGKEILFSMREDICFFFDSFNCQFLGTSKPSSNKIFNSDNYIRFINDDMESTCQKHSILAKFSSHSFRVGYITKLLKTISVQKVAEIIGHKDIDSTLDYERYQIQKEEIRFLLKDYF